GTVWAVVLLIIHVTTGRHHAYARISLMCFIFPLVGWITGLWGKIIKTCETPKRRKHRITTIGVTMATLTELVMTIIYHTFICTADPHKFIPDGATFSSRAFVVYLVPLIMFPLAGWSLGVARGNIPQNDRSLVPKMSFEAVAALAGSVAIWCWLTAILSVLLFFGA
ncbi:MAG: adhesin, partial [Cutibacterium granulosum]|uniref:adhesin n=1 Tax=Cutibacterium granulosum TaxID=33011 RepID=UPI002B22CCD3